jgi:hypothetical protein
MDMATDFILAMTSDEPARKFPTFAEREAAARNRVTRTPVDFASVPPSQWAMHDRLLNWAKWARGSARFDRMPGSPMFNLYRSSNARREYGVTETSVPIDHKDATRIQVGVTALPDKHRRAIHWSYLHPKKASDMARELGLSLEGMAQIIKDARQFLINRKV